jgi:hypothetical protein
MNSSNGGWIRSPQSLALLWAALAMSLVLGLTFVVVNRPPPGAPNQGAAPLTDDQAAAQVVNSAREIVAAARLQEATGGYSFVSCMNETDPPYQTAFYMNFLLPQNNSAQFLHDVASAMIADGWMSPATGEQSDQKLTKHAVTSMFQRNPDRIGFAIMRIYGECRNMTDHRNDNPAWTEVRL